MDQTVLDFDADRVKKSMLPLMRLEANPIQEQQETETALPRQKRDVRRAGASTEADVGVASSAAVAETVTTKTHLVRAWERH